VLAGGPWLEGQLRARLPEDDQFDEIDGPPDDDDDDDHATDPPDPEVLALGRSERYGRDYSMTRREESLREREGALAEREKTLARREAEAEQRHERSPTAADALQRDPKFRTTVQAQAAQLVLALSKLPRRSLADVVTEENMALLEAVLEVDAD